MSSRTVELEVATTGTDDRGEYRIGGLSAGTFSVAVLTFGPREIVPLGGGRKAPADREPH